MRKVHSTRSMTSCFAAAPDFTVLATGWRSSLASQPCCVATLRIQTFFETSLRCFLLFFLRQRQRSVLWFDRSNYLEAQLGNTTQARVSTPKPEPGMICGLGTFRPLAPDQLLRRLLLRRCCPCTVIPAPAFLPSLQTHQECPTVSTSRSRKLLTICTARVWCWPAQARAKRG